MTHVVASCGPAVYVAGICTVSASAAVAYAGVAYTINAPPRAIRYDAHPD